MVDIMPKISGVEFEEAWKRRVDVRIDDDLSVPFISREDLLVAKLSAGRAQDLMTSMLCVKATGVKRSNGSNLSLLPSRALEMSLLKSRKKGARNG
jgi:hypothetical protein